jgi:hypothetical protein
MMAGVLPSLGVSQLRTPSETPWRQRANVGDASRVLRVARAPAILEGEEVVRGQRTDALHRWIEQLIQDGQQLGRMSLLQAALGDSVMPVGQRQFGATHA